MDPQTKGRLLSWDTEAWNGLVFDCKCLVIRAHLLNVGRGQASHKIFHLLPAARGQFASCYYQISIEFYSPSADFIDLVQNLLCGSVRMLAPEATCEH